MPSYRAIAAYYDAENDRHPMLHEDVPFFLGQLPRRRQSILEIGIGTGRAAIPMAQAGHRVVGVDYAKEMLAVARRKRDAVGLGERELELLHGDAERLDLGETFDWVCVFFNTFLAFTTLEQQDRVLQTCRRHLKPRGRLWLDVFYPDLRRLGRRASRNLEPLVFHVPQFDRTVVKTTHLRTDPATQTQRVTFRYDWIDTDGQPRREKTRFDLTWLFPRELELLLARNGFRLERLFGNYDGSPVDAGSPRLIARCRLA